MSIIKTLRRCAIATALTALASTHASADVLTAVTAPANWTFAGAAQTTIPNLTTPLFANQANRRFVVIFSAECAVNAPAGNSSAWTDVDIIVRNAAGAVVATLAPTVGSGDAFCSANGTAGFDGWESNSVTAVGGAGLPAGNYRVQVRARLNGGATGGWFGERSLVVIR
ncbi:hypothetical protein [Variovorax sp. YR752]|uniref:hypothetical protein n=1 Tax=Variovorax sp. YR752 TaxID=1884383 RepID=UPI0031382774